MMVIPRFVPSAATALCPTDTILNTGSFAIPAPGAEPARAERGATIVDQESVPDRWP
jgi:hypothetical protein